MGTDKKIIRILSLYDRLSKGKVIYLQDEINSYGISKRSIQRDIADIRAYLAEKVVESEDNREIIYDHSKNCYFMTDKNNNSDQKDIYAIAKILLGSKGFSRSEMQQSLDLLLSFCRNKSDLKEVKRKIAGEMYNYQGPAHGKCLIENVWKLAQAVEQQNYVEVNYRKLDGYQKVKRILEPVGVMFSEYYFYLLAFIKGIKEEKGKNVSPTIYRIDRIVDMKVLEEHYQIPYSERFDEQKYRNSTPLMFGGDIHRLKFWYSGPSLEAVLDRIPTARVIKEEDGRYLLSAEVIGTGAEMWLRSQGDAVEIV